MIGVGLLSNINILSIDGGGIKGIISAIVLEKLEELLKQFSGNQNARLVDYFDLIAGTSTGSILAAIYLCPDKSGKPKFSASDATKLYREKGKYIFTKRPFYPINTLFGLLGPKYSHDELEDTLTEYFENITIGQLLKPCLITAYDTEKRKAIFFNTVSSKNNEEREYLLKDAVLASTSAPTYFPPAFIKSKALEKNCLVDGGVFANNPALCALIEGMKLPKFYHMNEVLLLSVANVSTKIFYEYCKVKKWGLIRWAIPILDILMDANEETVDYQLSKLFDAMNLSNQYIRIEKKENVNKFKMPKMDDASPESIKKLISIGYEVIDTERANLERVARLLIKRR